MESKETNSQIKKKILQYLIKFNKGTLKMEELQNLCELLVIFCKETRHSDSSLKTPKVVFGTLNEDVDGEYDLDKNSVTINIDSLKNIFNDQASAEKASGHSIFELINTIGHEMEHYEQNSKRIDYDNLTAEEQQKVDQKSFETIQSVKQYFTINEESMKKLDSLLFPYVDRESIENRDKIYEKYTNTKKGLDPQSEKDFYNFITYAAYYTILVEKEARDEGLEYVDFLFKELTKDKKLLSNLNLLHLLNEAESYVSSESEKERNCYNSDVHASGEIRRELYSLRHHDIMSLAEAIEKDINSENVNPDVNYSSILQYLLQDKYYEQKLYLLESMIYHGFTFAMGVTCDSIVNEGEFKANKKESSAFICNCLIGKAYEKAKEPMSNKSFNFNYSKLLTQEDFAKVICALGESKREEIVNMIQRWEGPFSIKTIETILGSEIPGLNKRYIFDMIISKMSFEDRLDLLKNGYFKKEQRRSLARENGTVKRVVKEIPSPFKERLYKSLREDRKYRLFGAQVEEASKIAETRDRSIETKVEPVSETAIEVDGVRYNVNTFDGEFYYCPDNVVITRGGDVKKLPDNVILADGYLFDLNKNTVEKLMNYDDCFIDTLGKVKRIKFEEGVITLKIAGGRDVVVKMNENNQITYIKNNNAKTCGDNFMVMSRALIGIEMNNLKECGDGFLADNCDLEDVSVENLGVVGEQFLHGNPLRSRINVSNKKSSESAPEREL